MLLNKAFRMFFAVAMALGPAAHCLAILGETEAELEKRHGKPVFVQTPPDVLAPAEKSHMWMLHDPPNPTPIVKVLIHRGRSVRETYSFMKDGKQIPLNADLAKTKALLDANAQGATWEQGCPDFLVNEFQLAAMRSDGKAFAYTRRDDPHVLIIDDIEFVRATLK